MPTPRSRRGRTRNPSARPSAHRPADRVRRHLDRRRQRLHVVAAQLVLDRALDDREAQLALREVRVEQQAVVADVVPLALLPPLGDPRVELGAGQRVRDRVAHVVQRRVRGEADRPHQALGRLSKVADHEDARRLDAGLHARRRRLLRLLRLDALLHLLQHALVARLDAEEDALAARPLTGGCLSRVTQVDYELFAQMKRGGCKRIFFGIESGDEGVLKQMQKGIKLEHAEEAAAACVKAGIKAAGVFMVGYLGETPESLMRTIRLSSHPPLDYVSYTIAYPLPGTKFHSRVAERRQEGEWHYIRHNRLLFNSDFTERKLRFAIIKGAVQHKLRRHHMKPLATAVEVATDPVRRAMR